jgi:hypothetical protein
VTSKPQALSRQLDRFITQGLALEERSLLERQEARGYMAHALIQATLPHSDPGPVPLWGRRNGRVSLSIQPGAYFDSRGQAIQIGLPFGSFPRIVLAMLVSEAVRTKSRRIYLGDSITDFFRRIEREERVQLRGGPRGELARFREQMRRLLSARVAIHYDTPGAFGFDYLQVADKGMLLWDPANPGQRALFQSYIELAERFYEEAVRNPVPIDLDALRVLRRSPLAIDIFLALSLRFYSLTKDDLIPWSALQAQFGADYSRQRAFREKFKQQLERVKLVYPAARAEVLTEGLRLQPSPTYVPKRLPKALGD